MHLKRILKYEISIEQFSIKYCGKCPNIKTLPIDGYADAEWASNLIGRKSTSGYVCIMSGGPISWTYRRQIIVAVSTVYIALSEAARQICTSHLLRRYLNRIATSHLVHRQSTPRLHCRKRARMPKIRKYQCPISIHSRSFRKRINPPHIPGD